MVFLITVQVNIPTMATPVFSVSKHVNGRYYKNPVLNLTGLGATTVEFPHNVVRGLILVANTGIDPDIITKLLNVSKYNEKELFMFDIRGLVHLRVKPVHFEHIKKNFILRIENNTYIAHTAEGKNLTMNGAEVCSSVIKFSNADIFTEFIPDNLQSTFIKRLADLKEVTNNCKKADVHLLTANKLKEFGEFIGIHGDITLATAITDIAEVAVNSITKTREKLSEQAADLLT